MSNKNLDDFKRQSAEEEFLRLAALEIESEENDLFLEAQNLPDPPSEVLRDIEANILETMRKNKKKQQNKKLYLKLGRLTACAAALCCLMITGVYFGVDAARFSINNFVMELFDGHAVIRTEASMQGTGALLPENWEGPFSITWVPARFTSVQSKDSKEFWGLVYSNSSGEENLSIYVWNSDYAPSVNTEGMMLLHQKLIQDSLANIYSSSSGEICSLIWSKSNYLIQIGGTISSEEAEKIAESLCF